MHDLGDMLVQAGFADPVMDQETSDADLGRRRALLAELRALGGNADPARQPGLRTPRWRSRLGQALQQLHGADGRLRLDFEVVYGHAFTRGAAAARGRARPRSRWTRCAPWCVRPAARPGRVMGCARISHAFRACRSPNARR